MNDGLKQEMQPGGLNELTPQEMIDQMFFIHEELLNHPKRFTPSVLGVIAGSAIGIVQLTTEIMEAGTFNKEHHE